MLSVLAAVKFGFRSCDGVTESNLTRMERGLSRIPVNLGARDTDGGSWLSKNVKLGGCLCGFAVLVQHEVIMR